MKQTRRLCLALFWVLLASFPTFAVQERVNVKIDGKSQNLHTAQVDVNGSLVETPFVPYIFKGRTFVPIREITESMGARVEWDQKTKSATISLDNQKVQLKIDSQIVYVNGDKQNIQAENTPKFAKYSRPSAETKTMVPLRFLSEAFGFDVQWDQSDRKVTISNLQSVALPEPKEPKQEDPKAKEKKETKKKSTEKKNQEKSQKAVSIDGQTSSSTEATKVVEKKVLAKKKKLVGPFTVVLDAGHGGKDSGAIARDGHTTEKELNLQVTTALAEQLRAKGFEVIETRTRDVFLELVDRAELANEEGVEIFVSVHFNSSNNKAASGIEVLYAPGSTNALKTEEQSPLARCILNEVLKATGGKSRGIKARPDLVVLKKTKVPAALAELGFLSNEEEFDDILNPSYFQNLINGMAEGIARYAQEYTE